MSTKTKQFIILFNIFIIEYYCSLGKHDVWQRKIAPVTTLVMTPLINWLGSHGYTFTWPCAHSLFISIAKNTVVEMFQKVVSIFVVVAPASVAFLDVFVNNVHNSLISNVQATHVLWKVICRHVDFSKTIWR